MFPLACFSALGQLTFENLCEQLPGMVFERCQAAGKVLAPSVWRGSFGLLLLFVSRWDHFSPIKFTKSASDFPWHNAVSSA